MAIESVDNPALQRAVDELTRQADESMGVIYIERDAQTLDGFRWFTIDGDIDLLKLVDAILG